MASPRGKPDEWSQGLWDAYKFFGESDWRYVRACNAFLREMLWYRLHETLDLVRSLMHLFIIKGEVPNHEEYLSGIASIDLAEMRKAELHDELDVYRHWYGKYIKWPEECLCEREEVELDRMHGLLSPKVGQHQRIWRTHPMFLSACVQVARRSLEEDGFDHLELYTPQGKHEIGQPIPNPKTQTLWITASVRMEAYLQSGQWRIDDAPMENLKDSLGQAFVVDRKPDEDRRDYFNRVKDQLDDRLIRAMQEATRISLYPKVKLQSGQLFRPANRHEQMLVLRMFGATRPEIADAISKALLDKQGDPLKNPLDAVSDRTERMAQFLGFLQVTPPRRHPLPLFDYIDWEPSITGDETP